MGRHQAAAWLTALAAVGALVMLGLAALAADEKPAGDIDFNRARELIQKLRNGETLSPEEQAYVERAKEAYARGARPDAGGQKPAAPRADGDIDWKRAQQLYEKFRSGQTLTPEEQAYLERAKQARAKEAGPGPAGPRPKPPPATEKTGLIPLDQMTAKETYKGEDGGLYGGGANVPPPAQQKAAEAAVAKIVPLDADGQRATDGKIVLMSIGMSNTTQEFSRFKQLAESDPAKSPQVVIVDSAQGGQDGARWAAADLPAWQNAFERLKAAGVTPRQVQAVWMKHARIGPSQYGEFPKHGEELKGHVLASLNIAQQKFPNLRVAYLSSRIYAGYAASGLNPEPFAYESAFVVRGLIRDQIKGVPGLNCDPAKGDVKAPVLLWGPYLWGDGVTPRRSDGLVWLRDDLAGDGTHPSNSGRDKVGKLLLNFLKTDPNAKGWFCKAAATR